MGEFIFNSDDVRNIILNAYQIKKECVCERCNGTGYTNWNGDTGDDEKAGQLTDYDGIRMDGECETCEGVGYKGFY